MNQEDLKNLMGWLQAIYKEAQETRGATIEMRRNVQMIPDIRENSMHGSKDSGDTERMLQDTKNHLETRMNKLEDMLRDISSHLKDIQSKVDHLK